MAVGTGLVLWFGARMVLDGSLSPGSLVVFILYFGKMYKPMQELSKMTDDYSKAAVGYERIREVLDTERDVKDLPRARRAPRFKGKIEFEKVSFSYEPDSPILHEVSFTIEPGQLAAIVGPTGAGKSSIISLIPRFYEPNSGVVKIDGYDVRQLNKQSIRQQISFVLQETLLFHAPVWQNIAYGKPEASRAEILHAAEIAMAHEFIEKMPEGYDTMIGERGVTLFRRPAPAHRHRPRRDSGYSHPHSRRADLRARRGVGKTGVRSAGSSDGGQNRYRDCASAFYHSPSRYHPGVERRRHHRERQA